MKKLILALCSVLLLSCGAGSGETPTEEDITQCMHKQFDRPGDDFSAGHAVEIHDIKIGLTEATNEQDKIDGIPAESSVTMVKVDYTDRAFYADKTIVYRNKITAKAFKDDFGEWKILVDGSEDTRLPDEPAKPR